MSFNSPFYKAVVAAASQTEGNEHVDESLWMLSMISEVTRISPQDLCNKLNDRVIKKVESIVIKAYEYLMMRLVDANSDAPNLEDMEADTTAEFEEFSKTLRDGIQENLGAVENFIYSQVYRLDPELFKGGFIRFAHHKDIDYTDPKAAGALVEEISQAEESLDNTMTDIVAASLELQHIESAIPLVGELTNWLDQVVSEHNREKAMEIGKMIRQMKLDLGLNKES